MNKVLVGIDVGSYHVKVVVAREDDPRQLPRILGTGYAESRGLRHGYVISIPEAARSVAAATVQAAKSAECKITRAFISVGGTGLDEAFARGETVVERGDSVVTERDVARSLENSEAALPRSMTLNRKVIHRIPLFYSIDGNKVQARSPVGMRGARLSVETIFITCVEQHINDLIAVVEGAGIEVEDIVAGPLAASFIATTKMQKRVGSVLVAIGSETSSMIVFDEMVPLSLKVFPMGGSDITNDLALALRIPPEEAEQLKHGAILGAPFPKKKIDDIINTRTVAILRTVEAQLKKLGKHELLPGGSILTGGTSSLMQLSDTAKTVLKLPSRIASIEEASNGKMQLRDGSWATAYGLTVWGFSQHADHAPAVSMPFREAFKAVARWCKKLLP